MKVGLKKNRWILFGVAGLAALLSATTCLPTLSAYADEGPVVDTKEAQSESKSSFGLNLPKGSTLEVLQPSCYDPKDPLKSSDFSSKFKVILPQGGNSPGPQEGPDGEGGCEPLPDDWTLTIDREGSERDDQGRWRTWQFTDYYDGNRRVGTSGFDLRQESPPSQSYVLDNYYFPVTPSQLTHIQTSYRYVREGLPESIGESTTKEGYRTGCSGILKRSHRQIQTQLNRDGQLVSLRNDYTYRDFQRPPRGAYGFSYRSLREISFNAGAEREHSLTMWNWMHDTYYELFQTVSIFRDGSGAPQRAIIDTTGYTETGEQVMSDTRMANRGEPDFNDILMQAQLLHGLGDTEWF